MGVHSTKTQALCDEICSRMSKGETLASICRSEHMPEVRTVSDWKAQDLDFSAMFARAREAGFDVIADDCLAIADDGTNDFIAKQESEDGQTRREFDAEHVQRSKLRIETRLKLLAKWDYKRYGDKVGMDVSGNLSLTGLLAEAEKRRKLENKVISLTGE